MKYQVNEKGFYGKFGGAYIPEELKPNVKELEDNYLKIINSEAFQKEFKTLLKDYVGRPSPLYYAQHLSEKHQTNIFLKREDLNHTGAHKINNTIGQILIAKHLGKTKVIAETGAGQHGVATATACALMGMECTIVMGAEDIKRQAPNVLRMKMLGATVKPANSGSATLKEAVDEALVHWIQDSKAFYLLGSAVGPHPYPDMVLRLQSIISEEIKQQLKEKTGKEKPDTIVAAVGGGSNAGGAFYHFLEDESVELVVVESSGYGLNSDKTAATLHLGKEGILHGSKTIVMQDENGEVIEPHSISAGLDYPGVGPLFAHLYDTKRVKLISISDKEALNGALELSQKEGIIPALESAHAIAALSKMTFDKNQVVVVNVSGRGDKDLETYIAHFDK